ncbi:uncharacterized protein LOC110663827 isoform X2 [Hevea brasiliensis]|nr:uncharacterized protein LOC110663827 isoform X2 [Hevea brasiliensis]XP_057985766.1 uncharacterized protein LOC110663827 isoform X2 [Hevea brasiliensis]
MGVGWGYGANMLTKYLAEVGERTPLTAATCINNPFDLEEATRCSPYHIALDQKLTGGLIDILRSNKELFQGRAKGFHVEKALMAKSVRDFEKAISMVSYGFEKIEEFYSKSSTRDVVGNVNIPVLFIQNDDGTVPLFSTPRSLIAENPFTSLLLCSCMPSGIIENGRAALSWCHNLTIEWLSAVELGLLKGRHPLLKDVDVTFNPTKSLTLVGCRTSKKGIKLEKFLDLTASDANGYTIDPMKERIDDSYTSAQSRSRRDSYRNLEFKEGLQEVENGAFQQTSSVDVELAKEEVADSVDTESGQVLQTAKVVMNMLDVTVPGILEEEEKNKVLSAVGQGETLMKALQDAVPEDVRGKLTGAVTGILHAQNTNLKLDGLLGKVPAVSSAIKSKFQEKSRGASNDEATLNDPQSLDEMKIPDDLADVSGNNQPGSDKSTAGLEPEHHSSENLHNSSDLGQPQTVNIQQGDPYGSVKGTNEPGNNHESNELVKEKAASYSNSVEKGLETSTKQSVTSRTENAAGTEEAVVDEYKVDEDGGMPQLEMIRETNTQKNEEKMPNSSTDQSKMASGNMVEEASSPAVFSSDSQPMGNDSSDTQKRDNKAVQPVSDQNKPIASDSNSPTFNVAQALDALTGMDDSTQVAVNSVFGVIEDIISQLEEEKDDENKIQDRDEVEGETVDSRSKKENASGDSLLKMNGKNDLTMQPGISQDSAVYKHKANGVNPQNVANTGRVEEKLTGNSVLYGENGADGSQESTSSNYTYKKGIKKNQLVGFKFLADYADKHVNSIPLYITANPYGDYLQNEYFRRYLLSKMPNGKPLDLDTTTALLLDYFPEEGQWKLLEQPGNIGESIDDVTAYKDQIHSPVKVNDTDNYIEPSYVLLDAEKQQETVGEYSVVDNFDENVENGDYRLEEVMQFVKILIVDALRFEIDRKFSTDDMKEMESTLTSDLEQVANAVSLAIGQEGTLCLQGKDFSIVSASEKMGTLQGECIVRAISSAVLSTSYLRSVLPVGVVIGSSLAALRKYFNVGTRYDNDLTLNAQTKISREENLDKSSIKEADQQLTTGMDQTISVNITRGRVGEEAELKNTNNDTVMVGAVTAALGASALLVQQQSPFYGKETEESSLKSLNKKVDDVKAVEKADEAVSEKIQNNVVASLAEKAMSVAGPVVPTNEDGEVDQERLVAMLADLGQRGGLLRLVGKVALLWGGLRGATSLTDRLISFLRMAERPLYQRIIGFVGMVLVLWSPIIVPLLPTLVQSWTTNNPSRFASLVSIIGLYMAVMILVMLWGRRIRGYEDPLEEYGLDLMKPHKIKNFFMGLIGGVTLVLSIQSINALLGCVSFSWPSSLPTSSSDAMVCLKVYGQVIILTGRGIVTATGLVLVEELLFRSWLPDEIATDLGYHQGIIISGLAFSLLQRSLLAIPGLWLLSLALAGLRQRSEGSLSFPIGLHAGITASSFILRTSGFLTYKPNYPLWVTGTHSFQPFSGVVGLAFSSLLAIILYPRESLPKNERIE